MKPLPKYRIKPVMPISSAGEVITLRDHFAGLAMQGMLANSDYLGHTATDISEFAYVQADAMLKQRSLTND